MNFQIISGTEHSKHSGLKPYQFKLCRSEVQHGCDWANINVSAGLHFFLAVLGKTLFPCLFQFLEIASILWLVTPYLIFKASNGGSSHCHAAVSLAHFHCHTLPLTTARICSLLS